MSTLSMYWCKEQLLQMLVYIWCWNLDAGQINLSTHGFMMCCVCFYSRTNIQQTKFPVSFSFILIKNSNILNSTTTFCCCLKNMHWIYKKRYKLHIDIGATMVLIFFTNSAHLFKHFPCSSSAADVIELACAALPTLQFVITIQFISCISTSAKIEKHR